MIKLILTIICAIILTSCGLQDEFVKESMDKFDDQAYKDAIALVELYKLRNGFYPESLDDIEFAGAWDMIKQQNMKYSVRENGYTLVVGSKKSDDAKYPEKFYRGLGLIRDSI